jgi:hypothetical protein
VKIGFGDFLPDLPSYGSPGVTEVFNLYPSSVGYRPVGQFVAHTDALPSKCKGASAFVAPSGRIVIIAGTATSLYVRDGLSWTQIGTGYTMPTGGRWRFAQFGAIAVVTNANDPPIKVNLETDATAALGGSPPTMEALAVVNNFLVGTKTNGSVNLIGWSGENDAEWWTFAQRKSDFQEFPDGGEVTGIIGGEIGLILQRNAVRRMSYVGGNVLFRFDKISANVGCATIHSVAQHGELAFWYDESGFKMWDGVQIKPIGFEKVDRSFAGLYGLIDYNNLSTAVDGQRNTVCWSTGRMMWLYNWLLDKWTVIDHDAEIITPRERRAPGLEEEDTAIGLPDDDIDSPGLISLDSGRYTAGDPVFYVFSDGVMGTFNGLNMETKGSTRWIEMAEGRDTRVRKVRPMTDAKENITIRLDTTQRLGDVPRRRDFTTLSSSGEMPVRARGRFVRVYWTIAAGTKWAYLEGADVTIAAGGRR